MAIRRLMILAKDRPGAICRITGMFMRRGYDIRSLSAAPMGEGVGRITMAVEADPYALGQLMGQLERLEDILTVQTLRDGVVGECMLLKVSGDALPAGAQVLQSEGGVHIVLLCGAPEMLQAAAQAPGVLEYARSGEMMLQTGADTLQNSIRLQDSLFDRDPFPTNIDR